MSLKLNERYPGRFNNPSAGYPGGSFKNRTTPTAKDGSYLEKDWANDKEGFFQSLLSAAGITANGAVDAVGASQFFDALQALKQIQAGTAFTTAGSAGALTLAPTPVIPAYSAPLRLRVKFSQASTGTDTINVSGLGAKNIKQYNSAGAKVAAVFAVNQLADVEYDGTDMVVLDPLPSGAVQATESLAGIAKIATQAFTDAGVDDSTFITPKKLRFGFVFSAAANGYVIFPTWLGSLVIQWGTATIAAAPTTVNFPVTFGSDVYAVVATSRNTSGGADVIEQPTAPVVGSFQAVIVSSQGPTQVPGTFQWLAVGKN